MSDYVIRICVHACAHACVRACVRATEFMYVCVTEEM